MSSKRMSDLPFVEGVSAGIVTWILGYVLAYLIVAPDIRESSINRLVDAFDGAPATYEMVGWVFYNAHFVDTVFQSVPLLGSTASTYIGGEDGFTTLLYLIPVGLLVAAGLALARYQGSTTPTRGMLVGVTAVPGYLLLSIAGVFLFEVNALGASGAPDLLPAIGLAGIAYPLVFAGAGGALGGFLEQRE
ncbi:hypothetical protein [Halanaeroarchaeum sulfurireducens]|uniref:DUF7978 domain-containing protein n=1 Tax=Halanaeroarchaeum sulfurireducens TaxID=1604004 RepID=A0A0F7PCU8_9EURY|nr:hypothetical protein [Halanaeroarchaeum sulfurireducens]AKH97459.1 hypothetical protein HLASF_0969 [Halanaeroarchaeum sulfurireducens]ALG81855.1 hypothetical protein HLASA_0958 [Halanaeroarchaeum sulfurireducens]